MTQTIARQLAQFACDCSHDALPPEIAERTKLYILDTFGAIQAGANEPSTRIIADVVLRPSRAEKCTIIGRDGTASPLAAAMVNGAAAHAVEIDDDHRQSALHPGAVVVPAALAACEEAGADGKTLIAAVAVGYEVAVRVGMAMGGTQDRVGFHSTSTCGVFGAAAAAGVAFGLSPDQMSAAFGLAGSQACGLQEWKADGSWTKRMHAGKAAEAGVLSAMMAARGYTAPDTVFEGDYGFLKAFSGKERNHPDEITRGLGRQFLGAETAFKPYACCRFSHQLIDAVLDLKSRHGFQADEITRADIRIYRTGFRALFEPHDRTYRPETIVDAQFSIPYIFAITLLYGGALPAHFNDDLIRDANVLALMDRVHGQPDDVLETLFPEKYGTDIIITLTSGQTLHHYADVPSGDPMKDEYQEAPDRFGAEIIRKYTALMAATALGPKAIDRLVERVMGLEDAAEVRTLANALRQPILKRSA